MSIFTNEIELMNNGKLDKYLMFGDLSTKVLIEGNCDPFCALVMHAMDRRQEEKKKTNHILCLEQFNDHLE